MGKVILLTREAFAKACGVSVAVIRNREAIGDITPARRAVQKGRGHKSFFSDAQIAEFRELLQATPSTVIRTAETDYEAAEAQVVFEILDRGEDAMTAVLKNGLHPRRVMAATRDYAEFRGFLHVSPTVLQAVNRLALSGPMPVTSEMELYEVFKACAADALCTLCSQRPKKVCNTCVAKRQAEAVQVARGGLKGKRSQASHDSAESASGIHHTLEGETDGDEETED